MICFHCFQLLLSNVLFNEKNNDLIFVFYKTLPVLYSEHLNILKISYIGVDIREIVIYCNCCNKKTLSEGYR